MSCMCFIALVVTRGIWRGNCALGYRTFCFYSKSDIFKERISYLRRFSSKRPLSFIDHSIIQLLVDAACFYDWLFHSCMVLMNLYKLKSLEHMGNLRGSIFYWLCLIILWVVNAFMQSPQQNSFGKSFIFVWNICNRSPKWNVQHSHKRSYLLGEYLLS